MGGFGNPGTRDVASPATICPGWATMVSRGARTGGSTYSTAPDSVRGASTNSSTDTGPLTDTGHSSRKITTSHSTQA